MIIFCFKPEFILTESKDSIITFKIPKRIEYKFFLAVSSFFYTF
jgi:hypothetical protein